MMIDDALAQEVANELGATRIVLNHEQVRTILRDESRLIAQLYEFGADDTLLREELFDVLCFSLIGENAPTFGEVHDGRDEDAFMQRLHIAAIAAGYTIISQSHLAKHENQA